MEGGIEERRLGGRKGGRKGGREGGREEGGRREGGSIAQHNAPINDFLALLQLHCLGNQQFFQPVGQGLLVLQTLREHGSAVQSIRTAV